MSFATPEEMHNRSYKKMLKIYKYCFYRITRFWDHPVHYSLSYDPLTQKVDPTHLISSMNIVSLLQISNLNTLLILPVLLLGHQLSANLLWIIVVAIAVFNVFILNKEKLYDDCEARWKDEPPKARKRNRWLLIAYFVASAVLMAVSFKIVYLPHSMTLPYWG